MLFYHDLDVDSVLLGQTKKILGRRTGRAKEQGRAGEFFIFFSQGLGTEYTRK